MVECVSTAASGAQRVLSVLVADDNELIRASMRGLIRVAGHEVDVVRDGHEAIEAAAARAYDVISLDVPMPGMDGLEAASRLGEERRWPRPWIVGLSAEHPGDLAFDRGVDVFLLKPAPG